MLDDGTRIIIQESSLLERREEQGLNFYFKIKYEGTFIKKKCVIGDVCLK
jgi:hypothetical protein